MKIKSVLAALIATAAVSCASACAFAESAADSADDQSTASIDESEATSVPNVSEAADPMEGNPVSGVDGAAALAGIALVAGAALVISHKHE